MYICEQIFILMCVFIYLGYYLEMELLDHIVPLFNFLRNQSVKNKRKKIMVYLWPIVTSFS